MIEAVACAIFNPGRDSILLVKRRDVPVWVFPGGGIDPGESPEEACLREGFEETGLVLTIERKVAEYLKTNALTRPTHLFACTAIGNPTLSDETTDAAFFSLDSLPYHFPPPYPEWLSDTLKKAPLLKKSIDSVTYASLAFHAITHPILVCKFLLQFLKRLIREKSLK